MLLAARDEDGSALSDAELRSQVITFLLAGHETTASTLTWAFALMAQHADEDTRVAAELASVGARDGTTALIGALPAMLRVNAVLAETLRLYPAIWIAERQVVAADELGGFQLPAGSAVIVAPYVTHRLANLWPEPHAFSPARFMTGARTLIDDGYFPFGAGPHACIGQHFALLEAKIILATLAARFQLHLVDGKLPVGEGGITLRPAGPVPVRVALRGR